MVDIATTLAELEAVAIRKSIEHGDDRWEANIVARLHELSKRPITSGGDGDLLDREWEARNTAFHESLYAACGSPSLIAFCRQLSERFSRYLRLWARHARGRDVAEEHRQISSAVLSRDADTAVALLQRHRLTTVDDLLRNWNAE
jgi:DNA-binding GntR family transcriptional regulator